MGWGSLLGLADEVPTRAYRGGARPLSEVDPAGGIAQSAWFSGRRDTASAYGNVEAADLKLSNPLVINAGGAEWHSIPQSAIPRELRGRVYDGAPVPTTALAEAAKAAGYDGVIFRRLRDVPGDPEARPDTVYAVFNQNAISEAQARGLKPLALGAAAGTGLALSGTEDAEAAPLDRFVPEQGSGERAPSSEQAISQALARVFDEYLPGEFSPTAEGLMGQGLQGVIFGPRSVAEDMGEQIGADFQQDPADAALSYGGIGPALQNVGRISRFDEDNPANPRRGLGEDRTTVVPHIETGEYDFPSPDTMEGAVFDALSMAPIVESSTLRTIGNAARSGLRSAGRLADDLPLPRDLPAGSSPPPARGVDDLEYGLHLTPDMAEATLARQRAERARDAIPHPRGNVPINNISPPPEATRAAARQRAVLDRARIENELGREPFSPTLTNAAVDDAVDAVIDANMRNLPVHGGARGVRRLQDATSQTPQPGERVSRANRARMEQEGYVRSGLDRWRNPEPTPVRRPAGAPDPEKLDLTPLWAAGSVAGAAAVVPALFRPEEPPNSANGPWDPPFRYPYEPTPVTMSSPDQGPMPSEDQPGPPYIPTDIPPYGGNPPAEAGGAPVPWYNDRVVLVPSPDDPNVLMHLPTQGGGPVPAFSGFGDDPNTPPRKTGLEDALVSPDERFFPPVTIDDEAERKDLQQRLAEHDLYSDTIDGIIGQNSRNAIDDVYTDPMYGLPAPPDYGPETLTEAYQLSMGLPGDDASVRTIQEIISRDPEFAAMLVPEGVDPARGIDNIYAGRTREAIQRATGRDYGPDLTQEEANEILYRHLYGNRRYQSQPRTRQ